MSSQHQVAKRDRILAYIECVLIGGSTKKEAYLTCIDSTCQNPSAAVVTLEKSKEYQDIHAVISTDENYKFQARVMAVRGKFIGLVEKNIDMAAKVLDEAGNTGDLVKKGAAVRLANETVQAMASASGAAAAPSTPGGVGKIDKRGVIS